MHFISTNSTTITSNKQQMREDLKSQEYSSESFDSSSSKRRFFSWQVAQQLPNSYTSIKLSAITDERRPQVWSGSVRSDLCPSVGWRLGFNESQEYSVNYLVESKRIQLMIIGFNNLNVLIAKSLLLWL